MFRNWQTWSNSHTLQNVPVFIMFFFHNNGFLRMRNKNLDVCREQNIWEIQIYYLNVCESDSFGTQHTVNILCEHDIT